MADEKPKKPRMEIKASDALIAAVKRSVDGSATDADYRLMATASDAQRRAARKAAGVARKGGGGGFRSTVDCWIQRPGAEAVKATKMGWKEFGALKKEVKDKGAKIKLALVPAGQKP